MGRGKGADRDAVKGARAWTCMLRCPVCRGTYGAHVTPPRFEQADIPTPAQTETDLLAEADWVLLAWDDPEAEVWRSPFRSGLPIPAGPGAAASAVGRAGRASR